MDSADTKRLRVLVVEDDLIDRKQMERLLIPARRDSSLSGCEIEFATYLDKAQELLDRHEFDILLLDLNLPDSSGLDTLAAVERTHPNVPKIVVTGEGDEDLALKAVTGGAQDYLVKGRINASMLVRVINYSIERKKSEEALRESSGKLNAILESVSEPMIMVDQTLSIIWSNEATTQMFGEDVSGKKCHQIYYGTDRPCDPSICIARRALADGKPHSHDVHLVDAEGMRRYFHCTANVSLRDKDDKPVAVLEIANDITDRKIAETFNEYTRAEAANRQLEQVQSQLVQSEKLASIGQLAAGVAHEMNTPVGFVACNFETLEGYMKKVVALLEVYDELAAKVESSNKEQRLLTLEKIKQLKGKMHFDFILKDLEGLFEDSKEGLERVTNIIQNLRDFSRVDQAGNLARYNINEGLNATLTVARNEIKYKADVETELGQVSEVFCNPGQINQVFLNILVNAAQAIESQQRDSNGHIHIRTYEADGYVVCRIEDDGPGIPAETLRKVFDPFFTTKPAGKGTGLGLSVSYDIIVNKHKGDLSVESKEGQGTTFTIKLPLAPVKPAQEKPEEVLIGVETDG